MTVNAETLVKLCEAADLDEVSVMYSFDMKFTANVRMDQEMLLRMKAGSPSLREVLAKAVLRQIDSMSEQEVGDLLHDFQTEECTDASGNHSLGPLAVVACGKAGVTITGDDRHDGEFRWGWHRTSDGRASEHFFDTEELAAFDAVAELQLPMPLPQRHVPTPRG